jgi:hypothetical protein
MSPIRRILVVIVALLIYGCHGSERGPTAPEGIDPPISDLSVTWVEGNIWANLQPVVPPDPIRCHVILSVTNTNTQYPFTRVAIPGATVTLTATGEVLGTIPLDTDWDGRLAAGETATVRLSKDLGDQWIFDPPCDQPVLMGLIIENADGESTSFTSVVLTFECVY